MGHLEIDRNAMQIDGPATKPESISASKALNNMALFSSEMKVATLTGSLLITA